MLWYLPTLFGDIRLETLTQGDKTTTKVTICGLSPQERIAMQVLLKRAQTPPPFGNAWANPEQCKGLDLDRTDVEQHLVLDALIVDVHKVLSKPLKPMRKQVSAVRFTDGRIEEITNANIGLIVDAAGEETSRSEKPRRKPKAAVTVAQPVLGCPEPDFDEADVRATRVLEAFLTDEQREDYARHQQFLVTGGDTGHRYLLTSRHAPKARFKLPSFQCVYDLDDERALCVHDWEVPAAEELLGLAMHLQIPGLETYVNTLPSEAGHGL